MPVNILAGIGGMAEFSMMTRNIPWPIAQSSFVLAMIAIDIITFIGLRAFENRRVKSRT